MRVTPSASLIVFVVALMYTCFAGKLFDPVFDDWAGPLFSCGLALIPLLGAYIFRLNFKMVFRLKKPALRQMTGGLIFATGLFLVVLLASMFFAVFFPDAPVSGKTPGINVLDKNLFRVLVSVVAMPAISEELLFRGFILSGFALTLNRRNSILLCALLFAFLHLDPLQLPFTFFVGLGLSWVALETGSLWIPVCMHALHNVTLLLVVRAFAASGINFSASVGFTNLSAIAIAVFCALAVAFVSFVLICAGIRLISRSLPCSLPDEISIESIT